MKTNILSDLEINEVSFVDRGAIGEKFSVIKMEDPNNCNPELLNQINKSQIGDYLSNLNNEQFVDTMKQMLNEYEQINKGGTENMDEKQIQEIVQKAINETMSTVNNNFATINKAVQSVQEEVKKICGKEEEAKKQAEEQAKKEEEEKLKNDVNDVKKSLEDINNALNTVAGIKKSVDDLVALNIKDTLDNVNKRLDTVEGAENGSQSLQGDPVQKSAGTKEVFWKSVLGTGSEE